ncbi:ceramide transfer protein-like [Lineus longissimus]|uniref:ceramide transfer protein-like n=1 Tax=Lineus longissimus TaxID=88925 RepID=UPI002B4FB1B6
MSEERDALSLTDDEENEEEDEDEDALPELAGTLSKWTNYIHGWQDRYIVLKTGTLSYYKSETETAFGCRGAISLTKAALTAHQFDECRFDVSVNDCLWYLRASNEEERQRWLDALDLHKAAESGYGSENSLRRQSSMLSLTSTASLSTASTSSLKRGRGLREKLLEMETFRDILCRQVDTLQSYFDACAEAMSRPSVHDMDHDDIDDVDDFDVPQVNSSSNSSQSSSTNLTSSDSKDRLDNKQDNHKVDNHNHSVHKDINTIFQSHGAHAIDFKGEAFTFKATTAGILATLGHCIELMNQREDAWRKKLEREIEKKKRYEEAYKQIVTTKSKPIVVGGPDFEEGPHCAINEDEFFDAVDAALDKLEKEEFLEEQRKILHQQSTISKPPLTSLSPKHKLYNEVNDIVEEHLKFADLDLQSLEGEDSVWFMIAEDGDMKVYKREQEEDGMVVDPLKACHTVKGVTGRELCTYFWDFDTRMEWETTIESTKVIDWASEDTLISYQLHKRVWPTAQRESLFWSHIRHCTSDKDEGPDLWIVVNYSTAHEDAPVNSKAVRITLNIAMLCQTIINPPKDGKEITRDDITCKMEYTANVNPGGWAPVSVLRAVYKREYPRFLKKFTQYVKDKTKNKPILF